MIRKTPARGAFDYLLSSNRITTAELNEALREASKDSKDIETILIEKYKVKSADLGASLSEFYHCPYIPYSDRTVIDPDLLKNISVDYLKKNA
jgi:hypothetical protein